MTTLYLGIAWLAGIYLASVVDVPGWVPWLAIPLPLAVSLLWWREWRVRLGGFCALVLLLGALRYDLALPHFDESTLAYHNGRGDATVVGLVADEPDVRETYVNLKVAARHLELEGQRREVKGLALVRAPRYPPYSYGDELQVEGELKTPPEFEDFSYKEYLARQGIHSLMNFPQITSLSQGHGDPFHRAVYTLKGRLQATIAHLFPEPSASLLTGILLGIETGIPDSLMEDFNQTSTTHIIAISGFNIAVVAGAIGLMTKRFLGVYRSALVSIVAIVLYTILVGADAAVVRAAIMGGISLLAIIAGRQAYALASLALAAFAMTLWNPLLLWDIGFQLSFAATLGLILLVPPFEERFESLLSRRLSKEQAKTTVRLLSEPLIVTLAAQLAVWPLTVYYFHRFSLISPLSNFLILPAQPPVMIVGGIATVAGSLHPYLGQPIAWVAWLFLAYTIRVVELTARIPFASFELGGFGAGAMWLYYAALGGVMLLATGDRTVLGKVWERFSRGLSTKLAIAALALLVLLAWIAALQMPDGRLHVVFFDVGQGDAIFIQCPNGQQILVDGGPSSSALLSRLGRQMPFWDRSLDLVVLTHPQDDHLAGLVEMLARYEVAQVMDSGQECDSPTCEAWERLLEEKGVPSQRGEAGMRIDVGGSVRLDILHPPAELLANTTSDTNNNSVVIRLSYGGFSLLLPGDIEQEAEEGLLASGQPLTSQVLKVPHHGADTSLTLPLLQAVDPEVAIISVGADNRFGHPDEVTVEKLQDIPSYRTDQQGNLEVVSDGERYWVTTER
jgi:competence protein ComEC